MRPRLAGIVAIALMAAGLGTGVANAAPAPHAAPAVMVIAGTGVAAPTPGLDVTHPLHGVMARHGNPATISRASKVFTGYVYSGAKMTISPANVGFGLSAMTVDLPTLNLTDDFHTLTELAVSNGNNTVETGWTNDPTVCGALSPPCLWGGQWVSGVFQGYNTNAVPAAGCTPCLNTSLSGAIGTTKQFGIQFISNANPALDAWWLSYNGTYQAAFLASGWPSSAFRTATLYQAFGELAAGTTPPTDSCSNIGSNVQPTGSPSFLGAKLNGWANVGGAAVSLTAIQTNARWPVFLTPSGAAARFGGQGKVTSPCPAS